MGKMTADELRRAGEAYRSENNGSQKSPVTVSANTDWSSKKMTASELRQAGEAYRKANGLTDPIYMESPATVVDKYSAPSTQPTQDAPSTQPTQAAPAGASSRKQSDAMKDQLDAIKKQRDDAAIKAGAYMRAGNMQQQAKEQQKIANKAAIEYENAYTQWKNQRNAEAVEAYNPDENKFKAGDAALSGVQNAFQSMGQYAAAASSYLSGNPEAQAWEAKALMDSGVSGTEAVKRAGLADKREIPITDYKTQAELRHEKNVASVDAVEGGALQLVNTISNMVPSLVANAVLPGSGLPVMAASAAGNKYADAYEKYGNTDTAFVLGSAAGGASMLTEQFGGLYGSLGKSAAGQAVAKKLMAEAPGLYNLANSVGGKWLRDALSEGIEEGAEDVINYAIEKAITGDSDEMDNFGYDMLLGALAGGVFGGGNAAMRSVTYSRVGKALNASPASVAQQVQEGMEKGAGTAPAIYAAEVQKNPSNQMVGRLYEANRTFDIESGLSKIQGDITQISAKEIKAMVSDAQALAQAAQKLNVEATPQAVATAITEAQRTESIKTAEDSVGQAFAPTVDNPANAGEEAYNSALAGVAANQGVAARINNDPASRQAFSRLTGVQFTGNTAQDIAAIEVATRNIAKSGKQAVSQAEYAQRVAAAGEQAAAQFDADMQAQAEQMQRESEERWLSVEQNTVTDVDGKRRIKEITNTDVRGNTEIGYKKAEIPGSKKKAVAEVNNAAKYLGKNIVWFEGAVQVNGQYRLTNGYRAPDGTIYVNINSRDPLMVTFGHEMFHDLVADGKYSGLIDTLVENPDYADMVKGMMDAKTELYERNGIELDPNAAAEEVAADISGDLLGSRDMLEYIGARNTEAATGIKGFLNRILKKLKGKPSAQEAYNRLSEAQKALLDGMEGRAESKNRAEDASGKYSIIDIENAKIVGDGDVDVVLPDGYEDIGVAITGEDSAAPNRYSLMSFGESDLGTDRFKYATRLAKATGVSVQQATEWIDSVYSVAAIIGDDKVRLDYEANRNNTSLKPNSEYDFSLDFSTLCAKRLLFSGTMDAIQSALPNTPLTSEDFVHLREIMKDSGYEVACGICYVESTRREFSTISEGFVEQYRKAQAEGTNIKKVNASGQTKDLTTSKGIENSDPNRFVYPEEGFTPTLADLVTAEGIDRLQVEHPEVYKAFNAYMNARGQQKPKMIETRTDYRGEILNMTKGQVSRRNSHGGLRIQSFSDFEVPHLIDMMQAVYDMASMGLKGQAYTKVPSFARAMGQTGIKINLSLIAKGDGVDANGKLIFDDVEGMPSSEAFAIRNDPRFSENVGTILVGKNVKHIVTAMADPEIDFIIPFHKSSWSASLYKSLGLEGYEDFTDYQNEKKVGTKIENYDPSEYWDFSKSGDENAQIYLAKCKADGRIPKFAEVMYNGKSLTEYPGYWKLLIDFKMYNNDGIGAEQLPVKPVFDDEFNAKLLNEYNGGHRKLPVARDIVDRFLKEKSEGSYSLMDTDSTGRELSAEQREYFLGSKVVDAEGRLKPVYHGSPAVFTEFSPDFMSQHGSSEGQGFYFTDYKPMAGGYQKDGGQLLEGYLDIKKPLSDSEITLTRAEVKKLLQAVDPTGDEVILNYDPSGGIGYPSKTWYNRALDATVKAAMEYSDSDSEILAEIANGGAGAGAVLEAARNTLGYDGYIVEGKYDNATVYVAFDSSQFKNIDNTSPTESKDIRYSLMDDVYLDAVKRGDTVTEQRLVSEAAKEAGAILDANGRRPLHLYHGTNTFGYTKFRDGVIYATPNQSVAAGYGRTGYAKPRIVSDMYVPDDGTMDTLIKNAKNVLDWKLQETTVNDRQEARDAVKKNADSIAALVDKVWTSDAVDAMELTEEQENALYNVLSLPSYISEVIDDIGTYTTVEEVVYWISRFNDGLPIIRSYINENRDSLKSSPAWDMARLILGYDLSDFAIDAEYRLLKSYEEDLLTNTNGNFVSADVVREEVEKAKDIGSYTLYGFAGDRPLVIDGGGAFWANVPVDVWGGTYTTDDIVKRAKDEGYTSVLIKNINDVAMNNYSANIKADIYAFFSPEQVKSADPVVYDGNGNVIPLSERFSPDNPDIRYSLMEDSKYMADIDKAVAEATAKSEEALKSAQAEVKELRQQLLDYRQRVTAEAKMNERWRDAETKLVADLAAAKEREKAAKARAEFMAKYDALAKQYRADLRANNQQAQEKYNEKLTEAKDEFSRRRTQDRIDRVVREDQAKSKARLRAAEQKSTTTDDVARVLTEMPKKDKETFKAKIAESWRTFKRQWINTKDELERFGNEVGDSRIMYAANNVGQASAAAQYSIGGAGQYDLNGKKIGDKNLMQVFEPAKKAGLTDEFYTYLLHEHNVDRMSVREKAQRQLAELRAKLNKEVNGFAEMTDENIATAAGKDTTLTKAYTDEQIAAAKQYKQFQAWAEKQFDKPVFGSSVTAEDSRAAADKLLKEHPEFEKWAKDVYAYLDGLMEVRKQGGLVSEDMVQRMKELYPHYVPTYRDMPSTSGGYSNPNSVAVNSTIKSAKGGNQDIMPLIDSIARQTLQTFSAAKKNILGNMLYEDAMDTTRDISEYIQNVTEDGELVDLDADSAENLKNTLRIWVDGKPVTLHVSEAIADGFRPIEQSNSFGMKALRSINSTFKKLVTQWNPVFIVRNFVRDAQSALYFTHYSNATFIKNYGKAVKEIATNGKYWQLYQAMGGKGTTYYDPKTGLSDRHHFKNGAVDKVAGGLNRVIDILSFANEAVEQYPRLAEFISTMEDTGDVQQALYNAADITTNFGRGGFAARKLNASLVPFFNPGMQGLSKNIRNVIDRRGWKEIGQLISRLLINGVMPGLIMSLVYDGLKEDEDYKELSNYIKDSNILIKVGDDKFIKVPMGREPSVITAFTNRMWRWLKGEPASSAFADYPSFAIEQLAPNNPLTNNIFAGITAMSTNKNWYGGDIVSSYMEEKPDYLQYDESTDAFSIWLGEITRHGKNGIEGLSPKKVNYLIDQYSGFIGDWVLPAISKKADVPAVVKAFVVDSVRQNRLGSDFYDALDEAKQVKETEFATAADDATYSYLYKQSKAASEITKQLKEIYNSGEKTRKEKMSEARDLLELRNEIYRNALLTVGTYEETAKSIDSADSDVVKREANRKAFGAEYALKTYNKDVGEKAAEYVAQGVTYDQYYAAYFATRGITGDKDENGKTITNSASRKKKEAIDKAVPGASTKQKHLLYEALGVSEKVW